MCTGDFDNAGTETRRPTFLREYIGSPLPNAQLFLLSRPRDVQNSPCCPRAEIDEGRCAVCECNACPVLSGAHQGPLEGANWKRRGKWKITRSLENVYIKFYLNSNSVYKYTFIDNAFLNFFFFYNNSTTMSSQCCCR